MVQSKAYLILNHTIIEEKTKISLYISIGVTKEFIIFGYEGRSVYYDNKLKPVA